MSYSYCPDPMTDALLWARADVPFSHNGVVYTDATCKRGVIVTARGAVPHLDEFIVLAFDRRALGAPPRIGAYFMCGGHANNAAILADPRPYGGVCDYCVDAAAGPAVYRCFNKDGGLIYIGSTGTYLKRIGIHAGRTPWWPEVADIKVERYPTIFLARAAEKQAIGLEHPVRNIIHRKARSA